MQLYVIGIFGLNFGNVSEQLLTEKLWTSASAFMVTINLRCRNVALTVFTEMW